MSGSLGLHSTFEDIVLNENLSNDGGVFVLCWAQGGSTYAGVCSPGNMFGSTGNIRCSTDKPGGSILAA